MKAIEYTIFEQPQLPRLENPITASPGLENPRSEKPIKENPTQLNKELLSKELLNTDSLPIPSNPSQNDTAKANGYVGRVPVERKGSGCTNMDAVRAYEEVIKDNIEYPNLVLDKTLDKVLLDEIVMLILETICTRRKTIRIAGDDYPAELVKSKFMKLNSSHIQFAIDCMHQNTTKIRNIKKYLLAVLFNAPNTIGSYYNALVTHDMANGICVPLKREEETYARTGQ